MRTQDQFVGLQLYEGAFAPHEQQDITVKVSRASKLTRGSRAESQPDSSFVVDISQRYIDT